MEINRRDFFKKALAGASLGFLACEGDKGIFAPEINRARRSSYADSLRNKTHSGTVRTRDGIYTSPDSLPDSLEAPDTTYAPNDSLPDSTFVEESDSSVAEPDSLENIEPVDTVATEPDTLENIVEPDTTSAIISNPIPDREYQREFNLAFVILGKPGASASDEEFALVESIKNDFPAKFNAATNGVAHADCSSEILFLEDNRFWQDIDLTQAANKFYEKKSDSFDFIAFFPNSLDYDRNFLMHHRPIQKKIKGIGADIYDLSYQYGSKGRLLGAVVLGYAGMLHYINYDINGYEAPIMQRKMMHEIGHQWGVYVGENFEGKHRRNLEIKDMDMHFYNGLKSHTDGSTFMKSYDWGPNGDGSYKLINAGIFTETYHPFQLYFMGMITENDFDFNKKFPVYDAKGADSGVPYNFDRVLPYSEVSIADIIKVEGKRGVY